MPLTLGNDLTGLVSREVSGATRTTSGLGKSLTTGDDAFVEVVDGFLGSALRDGEIILGALAKNTSYSVNLLTITDEYLSSIASSLQDGLSTITAAGTVSQDKLAVLQKNLDDKKIQANLLVTTAKFDGKNLLAGGAKSIDVQVGLNVTDKLNISVKDISGGKLFRSSITTALNDLIKSGGYDTTYYAGANNGAAEVKADALNNENLLHFALDNNANGSGSGGNTITHLQLDALVLDLTLEQRQLLDQIAPLTRVAISGAGGNAGRTFATMHAQDLFAALGGGANFNGGGTNEERELFALFADKTAPLPLIAVGAVGAYDADAAVNRARAQDVMQGALTTIRSAQAGVSSQKSNVVEAADALRASTNVTQAAADSYLKTDYVLAAQKYSEEIRKIVAAVTSLQAANKIPEAAQRLIDALAR